MGLDIRPIGTSFAAEVDGVDLTRPLTADEVAAIHAGMATWAVLVFHDQPGGRRPGRASPAARAAVRDPGTAGPAAAP